jgi:microcystin-dependent protein
MSGAILPGLALINNFDANGDLMRGALLRIYQAGTNTPVSAYKDSNLTPGQEHPWPIPADSAARLPMFYLASGDYRVRLASSDGGYVAYDVPILSAVSPSGGSGGGGGSVSAEVLFQTGYLMQYLGSGVKSGFVRLNGRSIGNATSGATERASADVQALFEYLWGEFNDTICPVLGGRGASATADFNANKALTLIDARGRTLFGADGMGASVAGRLTTATFATPDTIGSAGGAEKYTLTQAQLPAASPTLALDAGTLVYDKPTFVNIKPITDTGAPSIPVATGTTPTAVGGAPGGSVGQMGSNAAHPAASPGVIVTIYVKL